jgi:nitrogen fixation protein FixH
MKLAITSAHRWPAAIVAVLVLQVAFGVWMSHVAGNDPHFAVAPDYYARAVHWDDAMAQARADRALGWHAHAQVIRTTSPAAMVQITLTDSLGATVMPDSLTATAVAIAHSADIHRLALTPTRDGAAAPVAIATNGLWEIQLRAVRGGKVFTAIQRAELR